jgi:hypothetical protein
MAGYWWGAIHDARVGRMRRPKGVAQSGRSAREMLRQEAEVQERLVREAQERAAELALAREILKRGECDERVVAAPRRSPWGSTELGHRLVKRIQQLSFSTVHHVLLQPVKPVIVAPATLDADGVGVVFNFGHLGHRRIQSWLRFLISGFPQCSSSSPGISFIIYFFSTRPIE